MTTLLLSTSPGARSASTDGANPPAPAGEAGSHRSVDVGELFQAHADRVWRTLRTLGVHPSAVDDALQDVFLVVHQRLASFEGRAQLTTWLYAITYRVAQNYRRRTLRHSRHEALGDAAASSEPDPAQFLAHGQAAQFVEDFCRRLDEGKRDVFVLCVLEERTAPEAAELLAVKLNTVYSRIRASRRAFRAALKRKQRLAEEGT